MEAQAEVAMEVSAPGEAAMENPAQAAATPSTMEKLEVLVQENNMLALADLLLPWQIESVHSLRELNNCFNHLLNTYPRKFHEIMSISCSSKETRRKHISRNILNPLFNLNMSRATGYISDFEHCRGLLPLQSVYAVIMYPPNDPDTESFVKSTIERTLTDTERFCSDSWYKQLERGVVAISILCNILTPFMVEKFISAKIPEGRGHIYEFYYSKSAIGLINYILDQLGEGKELPLVDKPSLLKMLVRFVASYEELSDTNNAMFQEELYRPPVPVTDKLPFTPEQLQTSLKVVEQVLALQTAVEDTVKYFSILQRAGLTFTRGEEGLTVRGPENNFQCRLTPQAIEQLITVAQQLRQPFLQAQAGPTPPKLAEFDIALFLLPKLVESIDSLKGLNERVKSYKETNPAIFSAFDGYISSTPEIRKEYITRIINCLTRYRMDRSTGYEEKLEQTGELRSFYTSILYPPNDTGDTISTAIRNYSESKIDQTFSCYGNRYQWLEREGVVMAWLCSSLTPYMVNKFISAVVVRPGYINEFSHDVFYSNRGIGLIRLMLDQLKDGEALMGVDKPGLLKMLIHFGKSYLELCPVPLFQKDIEETDRTRPPDNLPFYVLNRPHVVITDKLPYTPDQLHITLNLVEYLLSQEHLVWSVVADSMKYFSILQKGDLQFTRNKQGIYVCNPSRSFEHVLTAQPIIWAAELLQDLFTQDIKVKTEIVAPE